MIPYVDWALVLVAFGGGHVRVEKGEERKERRKKGGEMGGCKGRVHRSTKRPRLLPGVLCSPSLKGDPHPLPDQMVFSEASQEGGKRRQKLDITYIRVGQGKSGPPSPIVTLRLPIHPSPKPFLPICCC